MPLTIGRIALTDPVLLAPMAGITDLPFRRMVARFGVGALVSEMAPARELVTGGAAARARAELGAVPGGAPTLMQIAGREPDWVAEAARIAEALGAPAVDLNMGCPAKKVTGGLSGSALMREPARALALVEAAVAAVGVPVTVKMRLGWDAGALNAAALARACVEAGAQMVTVHGRTRAQFYAGRADWAAIGPVARTAGAPVVANGDVVCAASARAALAASGAAGVMVGRGARGRPWVPAQIGAALAGRAVPPTPGPAARVEVIVAHYEDMLGFHGRDLGVRVARKHLGWHLQDAAGAEGLRARLMRETDPGRVVAALRAEAGDRLAEGLAAETLPAPVAA